MENAELSIAEYRRKIDSALQGFFDDKIKDSGPSGEFLGSIKEFNMRGGKRIRPILMIFGYKCFKEPAEKDLITASLAMELMEGFLLTHDDIIDEDKLRRGGLTMHEAYKKEYGKNRTSVSPEKMGKNMALLAGDLQNSFAVEILAGSNFPKGRIAEAISVYSASLAKTIRGCVLEYLLASAGTRDMGKISQKDISEIQELKTATYTIECPLVMGALLAGAGKRDLGSLRSYAIPLGKAFQIKDDILGVFGNEKKLGKPVGSDIREGKVTLLIVKALESCGAKDREKLLGLLGKRSLKHREIESARKIIACSGSLEYSQKLAESLVSDAKKAIAESAFRSEGKEFLLGIADYLLGREN